ncbi:helix-turn-helix domain-containing protein [Chelatococcus sambhunathii]|uniref:Helix-turn-helix domain-containing protein n=1 Tax=Chelatococcus sambhunathii TaxID=363953 RepID=A0ABU1DHS6_9HYPH|nr:helix-turn-helix domain-containing protein [Chelatococcus sambhunathii]MDR4307679.1 helix-turn-helix domain-containing protein [Chelatococcus sambhunathii]
MTVTPAQFRAARAMLNLSRADLAERANVSRKTVERIEVAEAAAPGRYATTGAVQGALEAAGVVFTEGQGVRLQGAGR